MKIVRNETQQEVQKGEKHFPSSCREALLFYTTFDLWTRLTRRSEGIQTLQWVPLLSQDGQRAEHQLPATHTQTHTQREWMMVTADVD